MRLGATPSLCTGLLPDVLRAFHDQHPGVRLLIEEGGSHDLVRGLARGALDLALVVLPPPSPSPALTTADLAHRSDVAPPRGDRERAPPGGPGRLNRGVRRVRRGRGPLETAGGGAR